MRFHRVTVVQHQIWDDHDLKILCSYFGLDREAEVDLIVHTLNAADAARAAQPKE